MQVAPATVPVGSLITINRFPYNRPNEVFPDAPQPTHRVIGHRADGYLHIYPLHGSKATYLSPTDAIDFGVPTD